jgi:DNA-binding response OmpR family regulator
MKILVVDDDAIITTLLENQLSEWGYEPMAYTKSLEALSVLTSDDAPKVAIIDWEMPIIDGLNICKSSRRIKGAHTYFIILTGNGSKQNVFEALQAGANDYVVKPFEPDDLKSRVETAVNAVVGKA